MSLEKQDKKELTICMGSSCYSRGNQNNLATLQSLITNEGLDSRVELKGSLCCGRCSTGPHIEMEEHHITAYDSSVLKEWLESKI